MTNLYQQADVIIFDLDGTLYEDTDHFAYFADLLKQEVTDDLKVDFEKEYERMIAGDHIVTIGKVYDAVKDNVLEIDSSSMKVYKAWTWSGTSIDKETITQEYSSPVQCDFNTMIAIGDGWWLPNVCAKHFGVADTYPAYEKTKEYMATDQFQLTQIPKLRDSLWHLKEKKEIILITNSQADDVQRLLQQLNLEGIFENIITQAKKPQITMNHFSAIMKKYAVKPEKMLSIGDNYINEIAPAIRLGMNTIFIDVYGLSYPEYKGKKVSSISETLEEMIGV